MPFQSFSGTPQFLQGNYAPTQNEAVDMGRFNFGVITFFWDRLNEKMMWLQSVDSNNLQTWVDYPGDIDSLNILSVLPTVQGASGSPENKFYWFIADYGPTSSENISGSLFDGTYGMLWWDKSSGNLYKLTAFSPNGDGTFNQTWTQIV
jgi:hypothetical protein